MPSNNSGSNRQYAVPGVKKALENFKTEVASEIGLTSKIQSVGYENMTSRECGSIGGFMTKKMVQMAEQALANQNPK